MSLVEFRKGRKHPDDKIVLYNGIPMTFYDWIHMGLQFYKNEDKIYPPPRFLGGKMLIKALWEICKKGHMESTILEQYKIPLPENDKTNTNLTTT